MKIFTGVVTSKKMEKTATVTVGRVVAHPLYKKRVKKSRKFQVHDELGVKVGDKVNFKATRPISKLKSWSITKIFNKHK